MTDLLVRFLITLGVGLVLFWLCERILRIGTGARKTPPGARNDTDEERPDHLRPAA